MSWTETKDAIEALTGLSRDALHIYAALLVQIGAAGLFRRRLSHFLPWVIVLAVLVANEYLDASTDSAVEWWEVVGGLHDLWNTMLVPTTLFLLARFAPQLVTAAQPARIEDESEASDEVKS